jgi:CDP-diacylglycerol--glycerol-3-phosphate 3-phosphatidyltransferase/cardiolipin synthase
MMPFMMTADSQKMLRNLPNNLTLVRIVLIPVLVLVFLLPFEWARILCALIFIVAAITDWLDGYLARKLDQSTRFGEFLDPVADKLIVVTALVLLVYADQRFLVLLPALVIIGREIAISALREWMAQLGEQGKVKVNSYGKLKTASQMVAISLMLFEYPLFDIPVYGIGVACLYLAATLTLWSMYTYLRAAWPSLNQQENG